MYNYLRLVRSFVKKELNRKYEEFYDQTVIQLYFFTLHFMMPQYYMYFVLVHVIKLAVLHV